MRSFISLSEAQKRSLDSRYLIFAPSKTQVSDNGQPYEIIAGFKVVCQVRTEYLIDEGFHLHGNNQII